MSDDVMSIDFGALRNKAAEMLEASEAAATPEPPAPVAASNPEGVNPTETRVQAAGQGPAPTEEKQPEVAAEVATTPEPAALSDDTLVKVTVDGEDVVMPWKDARSGISRTQKFTKSMQQLAKDREAIESQRATLDQLRTERDSFNRFLSDPKAVAGYLLQQFPTAFNEPQQPQAAVPNGDEVITRAEAVRLAEQSAAQRAEQVFHQLQQQLQSVDARIADANAALEHKQETAKHAVVINGAITDIFQKNPVLNAIPNAEDLIRFEVAQMKPQTQEQAVEAFRTVAQGMVEELGKHYTNQKKVQAVAEAKQKLVTKTIEPAGGTAPQIQPASFKNADGSVNWAAVKRQALETF